MIGATLNAAGIVAGGAAGLVWRRGPSAATESFLKVGLGAFTVFYGLRATWLSLEGGWGIIVKELTIAVLALMAGKLTGRLLRLQKASNWLGGNARTRIEAAARRASGGTGASPMPGDGFKVCGALFLAAPLGIIGAVQYGLSGYAWPLGIKAVMDCFAAAGFARLFGWAVIMSALPVLVLQGAVCFVCSLAVAPFLEAHGHGQDLTRSVHAVAGLMVFSVALVILQLKKIELADYLPSLIYAPLLTWLCR